MDSIRQQRMDRRTPTRAWFHYKQSEGIGTSPVSLSLLVRRLSANTVINAVKMFKGLCYINFGQPVFFFFFFFFLFFFLSHLLIVRCDIGVQLSVHSSVHSFVRLSFPLSVRPHVHNLCQGAYSVAVIAGSMKPCTVITLDTHFKKAP